MTSLGKRLTAVLLVTTLGVLAGLNLAYLLVLLVAAGAVGLAVGASLPCEVCGRRQREQARYRETKRDVDRIIREGRNRVYRRINQGPSTSGRPSRSSAGFQ